MFFLAGADRISQGKISRVIDTANFISPISIVSTRPKNPKCTYSKSVIYAYQEPPKVVKRGRNAFQSIRMRL